MSQGERIRQKLAAGREELGKAVAPREAGFTNAETMLGQVNEMRAALGGILEFFEALKGRIGTELGEPFQQMQTHYKAASDHILPALEGAASDNRYASVAWHNIGQVVATGDSIVERVQAQRAPMISQQYGVNFIDYTIQGLKKAEECMREVGLEVHNISALTSLTDLYHVNGDRATQQYAAEL